MIPHLMLNYFRGRQAELNRHRNPIEGELEGRAVQHILNNEFQQAQKIKCLFLISLILVLGLIPVCFESEASISQFTNVHQQKFIEGKKFSLFPLRFKSLSEIGEACGNMYIIIYAVATFILMIHADD